MSICRMCHKTIPDGKEFCVECEQKRMNQADESYLDSLLSSVSADLRDYSDSTFENTPRYVSPVSRREKTQKEPKPAVEPISEPATEERNISELFPNEEPVEIPTDKDILNAADEADASVIITEEAVEPESIIDNIRAEEPVTETPITEASVIEEPLIEEPLIEEPLIEEPLTEEPIIEAPVIEDPINEEPIFEGPINEEPVIEASIIEEPSTEEPIIEETVIEEHIIEEPVIEVPMDEESVTGDASDGEASVDDSGYEYTPMNDSSNISNEDLDSLLNSLQDESESSSEIVEDSSDVDDLLDSLLADMDAAGAGGEPQTEENIDPEDLNDIFAAAENGLPDSSDTGFDPEEGIPLDAIPDDLFPEISPEEMSGQSGFGENLPEGVDSMQTKEFLGEDELERSDMDIASTEEEIAAMFADVNTDDIDAALSLLDGDHHDANDKSSDDNDKSSGKKGKKKKEKNKKSLFERLFANVEEDPAEIAKREAKEKAEQEKKVLSAENKKKKKEQSKEDKEVKKAEDKIRKEEEAKKKAELKKQKKEEALAKARKKKEEKLALEEIETNPGKINRAGATILFVIFAIITVFIIVGTNIYSYNLSIQKAKDEFEIRHYNDAYYEVYGLKIQKNDIELYDKIMTVMYVNAQLNAYDYYMASNSTDLALDSLLRGLQRYDKYYELATKLDIEDDLNYVKSSILSQLSEQFGISEEVAVEMVATRDEVDYSEYIYALLGTYEVEIGE